MTQTRRVLTASHPLSPTRAGMQPQAQPRLYLGCAGWAVPKACSARFPNDGSHLQRYAQIFNGVEINSSFYRSHQPATYARWAASVPDDFRFAVKMPRTISHKARLLECCAALQSFLSEVHQLGSKLGCLLLQLPPSLAYSASVVLPFFELLRHQYQGPVACEPRHASWFVRAVDQRLKDQASAASPPIPHVCRRPPPPRAIRSCNTCVCTDRRGSTATATPMRPCARFPSGCADPHRTPSSAGASSTTQRLGMPRPTHCRCSTTSGTTNRRPDVHLVSAPRVAQFSQRHPGAPCRKARPFAYCVKRRRRSPAGSSDARKATRESTRNGCQASVSAPCAVSASNS